MFPDFYWNLRIPLTIGNTFGVMEEQMCKEKPGFLDDILSYISCRPCRDICINGNSTNSHTDFGL